MQTNHFLLERYDQNQERPDMVRTRYSDKQQGRRVSRTVFKSCKEVQENEDTHADVASIGSNKEVIGEGSHSTVVCFKLRLK